MALEVVMPQMGESIAEGTITSWLKKVGDRLERDEPLFEISTDKVDAEIPSPAAGVLREIRVQPGQTVPINTVVAIVDSDGAAVGAEAQAEAKPVSTVETRDLIPPKTEPATKPEPKPTPPQRAAERAEPAREPERAQAHEREPAPAVMPRAVARMPEKVAPAAPEAEGRTPELAGPVSPEDEATGALEPEERRIKSSPVVRRIAAEHDVDIGAIRGTGIGGRVTKQDILDYLSRGTPQEPEAAASRGAPAPAAVAPASTAPAAAAAAGTAPGLEARVSIPEAYRARAFNGDRIEEMTTMRAKIAEHMVLSRRISAHVGTVWDMEMSRIAALREKHKAAWKEQHGTALTYTAFIMKAVVDALKAFPIVNSSVDGTRVIYHQGVNLGFAVALDWGLIVPVVHGADELNLLGLARRANDLAERARTKKLKPDDVQNGTFTITNPGIYGPLFNLPIINQPQVAILGVGAVEKRPVVIDDMLAIRTRCYMSLSFDHRVVDGAIADQFMAKVHDNLESFSESGL